MNNDTSLGWDRSLGFSVFLGLCVCLQGSRSEAAVAFEDLLDDDARVHQVATGFGFADGPAWSPDGYLLFGDVDANCIHKLRPDGAIEPFLEPSGGTSGLVFDTQGNLFLCQAGVNANGTPYDCGETCRALSTLPKDGRLRVLVGNFDSRPLNSPNDLALDGMGGIYFTDPRYGGYPVAQDANGVYYHDISSGETRRVIANLTKPNGILVANDGCRLYVAELDDGSVSGIGMSAYAILGPGELGPGGRILNFSAANGAGPDGMAMDEYGNLYATFILVGGAGANQIVVIDPEGGILGRIPVPEPPANCVFGGPEGKTLFITARSSLYAIQMKVKGAPLRVGVPTLATVMHSAPRGSGTSSEPSARIAFTKPMDRSSVEGGFTVYPVRAGSYEWSNGDRVVTFRPDIPWDPSGEMVFRLSGDVMDATGRALDGNANGATEGSPTDDYEWSFTFVSPVLFGFDPYYGEAGARVTLNGSNLTGVIRVRFHETEATFSSSRFEPDRVISAVVPAGATTGPISVEGPSGLFKTATRFYVGAKAPPSLVVRAQAGSTFVLRWPAVGEGILEEGDSLDATQWNAVLADPSLVDDHYELGVETTQAQRFFRLR